MLSLYEKYQMVFKSLVAFLSKSHDYFTYFHAAKHTIEILQYFSLHLDINQAQHKHLN